MSELLDRLGPALERAREHHEAMEPPWRNHLDCPCCGDVGALPDEMDWWVDGQDLVCGCNGHVSVDRKSVGISIFECDCGHQTT